MVEKYHNIYVVYTREAETADNYIEKTVHEIGHHHHVTVATSDGMEQLIILGQGGVRISARGLKKEIDFAMSRLRQAQLTNTSTDCLLYTSTGGACLGIYRSVRDPYYFRSCNRSGNGF